MAERQWFHNLAFVAAIMVGAHAGADEVDLSPGSAEPVQFGAREIRAALEQSGQPGVRIVLGVAGDAIFKPLPGRAAVPADAESYTISLIAPGTVAIEGRDATGAMYGALDAAEQIRFSSGRGNYAGIQGRSKSPFLQVRGINTFLTAQGFDEPDSWFWSDEFWDKFLAMMARTRHNFLDLHGPFDLTVGWPNGFSYFVYLPEFSEVGVGNERAARNLARFRQIIRMAGSRGVKVGYMNYTAAAPIGPWNTGRFGKDPRYVARKQEYLPAARLQEYTRKAARSFLEAVPELWMFGFRVGESGQPEDFYKRTYIEAAKDLRAVLNLYTRTWIADPGRIREIAGLTNHRFFIEPKYNGEHLGLPYQAVTGGRYYPPSGSWEDYGNYPRGYSIIWQVRANGTHRVFHWGWPEFARRVARSCRFAGGLGFSMEPMNSYYPQTDYFHNRPAVKHDFYRWMFEQQWFWYALWGRTGYDPDVSDEVWQWEFRRRFADGGTKTYAALVENSKIVPFVYSYHNQGLDHQHMAPEFETGDHALSARSTIWQGSRLVPYGGGNDEFLAAGTMDRTAMADPASYVDLRLRGAPTGKMTPFEAARYLLAAADRSQALISEAADSFKAASQAGTAEFDCLRRDIDAVAWLGRYYANRIVSATHLEFYRRTYHHPELNVAHEYLRKAIDDWDRLSEAADGHFGFIPELIRMRVYDFRWRDEGRSLGADLEEINRMEDEFQKLANRRRLIIGHVPTRKAQRGKPLNVIATLASSAADTRLHLLYRMSQNDGYRELAMRPLNPLERTWGVEIPAAEPKPGLLEYYFEAYGGITGAYGGTLEHRAPYRVVVTTDDTRPAIQHEPPGRQERGNTVTLRAHVEASGGINSVRVYYKRTPAYYEWLPIEMQPAGGGLYTAGVPLTPEGILYYFEAVGANGSATNFPDFLKQTPYFAIEPWSESAPRR